MMLLRPSRPTVTLTPPVASSNTPLNVGTSVRYRVEPAADPLTLSGTPQPVSASVQLSGEAAGSSHELFSTAGVDVLINDNIESGGALYRVTAVNQYQNFLPHAHIFLSFLQGAD